VAITTVTSDGASGTSEIAGLSLDTQLLTTDAEPWILTCSIGGRVVVVASVEDEVVVGAVDVVASVEDEVSGTVDVVVEEEEDDEDDEDDDEEEEEEEEEEDDEDELPPPPDVDVVEDDGEDEDEDEEEEEEEDEEDDEDDDPPATTGIVTSVSVGMSQVTAVWIAPFSNTAVVNLYAFNVTAPEAGAIALTVIVGVVSVPGTNGPGVPVVNLSFAVTIVPSTAVSVFVTGVCGTAVGTIVAVPGFTIDPGTNVPPLI
jgi:hypothetical protein